MGPVIFVLLDACRSEYLSGGRTPQLRALAESSIYAEKLIPGAGFCERSEILTGTTPADSGNFTAIGYDPKRSPFRPLARQFGFLGKLPGSLGRKVAARLGRRAAYRAGITMPVHRIPLDIISKFRLTEDLFDHFSPAAFEHQSIPDLLIEMDKTWSWHFTALGVPNGDDDDRLDALEAALPERKDFYLAYVERADKDGHRFGPDSPQMDDSLARFDTWLTQRVARWRKAAPDAAIVIIGDHGMTQVVERVDVMTAAKKAARTLGLRWGKDWWAFLDSTMARFWCEDPAQMPAFVEALRETKLSAGGAFLNAERARQLHVPFGDRTYGDALWWAEPGVMIWPDYFHRPEDQIHGMHGYDPNHWASQGFALVNHPELGAERIEGAALLDLCPTLSDLLDIPTPAQNRGRSLLTPAASGATQEEILDEHS